MKRIISTLILLTAVFNMISASSLTQEADSAYMNDDFIKAAKLYEEIAANEGTSSNLFYNLGNAYYRQGKLRLDPSNKDARTNLAFVNSKITDEPGDRGMFISNTVNGFACKTPANTWSLIAIGSFVLLLGAITLYVFSSNVRLRKTGFFGGILLLGACVLANIMASIATRYSTSHNEAIIIEPSTLLSTSPRTPKDRSEEAMLLHEGTKLEILDSVTTRIDSVTTRWYDVKVDNNNRAWVRASAVERI